MPRSAGRILGALSAVLLACTVAAWTRSQWAFDYVDYRWVAEAGAVRELRGVGVAAHRQSVEFTWDAARLADPPPGWQPRRRSLENEPILRHFAGAPKSYAAELMPPDRWLRPSDADRSRWHGGGFGIERVDARHLTDEEARVSYRWAGIRPSGGHVVIGNLGYLVAAERYAHVAVPWWFLALLFSLVPGRALTSWRRRRRRSPHVCLACGYDLRATADPAGPRLPTCPECGAPSASAEADAPGRAS